MTALADSVVVDVAAAAAVGSSSKAAAVAVVAVVDTPDQGSNCSPLQRASHFFRFACAFAPSSI